MLISTEKINEILAKADIVSIISSYIKIQKKGRNYWSVCPFHDDSNPSMSISPEKKFYKCFSCGASGNVIDFVKNYNHLDFLSAVKIVADSVGINLEELNNYQKHSKYSEKEELIFKINEETMNFYMVLLASQEGEIAKNYLIQRNISKVEMLKWEIGYASKTINLHETLIQKGYTIDQINDAGLVTIKDGKVYDYFFDRIIFPIKNEDQKVIGFSGRLIAGTNSKYINTRETLVFKKSNLAFNISNALKSANLKKSLIVLEGFMDVISLNRIGVENSIAIMGTSLSEYHLKLFKNVGVEIKIFLDGDWAGVNSTLKVIKKLVQQNIKTTIVDNLTNQDPDELIASGQRDKVELMINNSVYPTVYAVEKLLQFFDLNKPDDLKVYLNQIFELISLFNDAITQEKTLKNLVKITNLSYDTLIQSLINYQKDYHYQKNIIDNANKENYENLFQTKKIPAKNHLNPLKSYDFSQREILHSLITSKNNLQQIEKNLSYIPNADLYVILQELINRYKLGTYHENNWLELMQILEISSFDYKDPKWKINLDDLLISESQSIMLDDAFLLLQEYKLKKRENNYEKQIKNSQIPELQKKWLEAKEQTHLDIINLRKKRGKK